MIVNSNESTKEINKHMNNLIRKKAKEKPIKKKQLDEEDIKEVKEYKKLRKFVLRKDKYSSFKLGIKFHIWNDKLYDCLSIITDDVPIYLCNRKSFSLELYIFNYEITIGFY